MRSYTPRTFAARILAWLMVVSVTLGSFQVAPPIQAASLPGGSSSKAAAPNASSKPDLMNVPDVPASNVGTDPIGPSLKNGTGILPIVIELQDDPIVVAQYSTAGKGKSAANQVQIAVAQKNKIDAAQANTMNALKNSKVNYTYLYQVENAYNGIAIMANAADLKTLANLPGVMQLHRLDTLERQNAYSNGFIGAPVAWGSYGITGTNVKIGVIDTGIDYIHTNFGGSGQAADYTYAHTVTGPVVITNNVQLYPTPKVVGGYDFAGDDYNARSSGNPAGYPYQPVPHPDQNPLDCSADLGDNVGHGSHVAGTAAGYGVNANGTTFTGPYNESTNLDALRIGPGVAPGAQLYALRVFGCAGSTNLTLQAIDWAVNPDGNPATNDHLDIVNLSLGSSYGSPDDPSTYAIDTATLAGISTVISAGNDGDAFYINGTPGSAQRALTVANSGDAATVTDGFRVTDPGAPTLSGVYPASRSANYGWLTQTGISVTVPVTAPLYYPATNQSGCSAFSAGEAANISGTIVLLNWATAPGTSTFPCGSAARGTNAEAAHAVGMILVSGQPYLDTSISGATHIPSMFTTATVGDLLKTKLTAGTVSNLQVTLTTEYFNSQKVIFLGQNDTIDASSSRGPQGFGNKLKPDIAAPGTTIFSTRSGSGNDGETLSGTSMAAPHMAGVMALLRQKFPGWTPEEYKAAAMNTANHDIYATSGTVNAPPSSGPKWDGTRMGAGRVDVAQAVSPTNTILAFNNEDAGAVSVSFGNVEVVSSVALTKTVKVENKSNTSMTYNLSITTYSDIPGVNYSFPQSNSVTVAANSSTTFQVQLTANAANMSHVLDGASPSTQLVGATAYNRPYLSDESANIIMTPTTGGHNSLRVPVFATARVASAMHASKGLSFYTSTNATLTLAGTGVNQGSSSPTNTLSLVAPLELVASNPQTSLPSNPPTVTNRTSAANIRYLGISSNYMQVSQNITNSKIYLGIATWNDWTIAHYYEVEYDVYFDTNKDGTPDYVAYNAPVMNGTTFTDLSAVTVVKLSTNTVVGSANFVNGIDGTLDTNVFNNNVLVLPIKASQLGLTDANSSFNYEVVSFDRFRSAAIDDLKTFYYDVAKPGLSWSDSDVANGFPLYKDLPGSTLPVTYHAADYAANGSQGMLLLHHQNTKGNRAEVVPVGACNPTSVTQSTDNGSGLVCGSLSYALANAVGSSSTITFTASAITLTNASAVTLTVPVNTVVQGSAGACNPANNIALNNSSGFPVTLLLSGGDTINSLTLNGVKLKATTGGSTANVVQCVKVIATYSP